MNNSYRYRYDERIEMFNRAKKSESYITDEDLNDMLDCLEWQDLTFVFITTGTGFRTRVVNNITDELVLLDDLDPMAYDYYKSKLTVLCIVQALTKEEKSQSAIDKIRNDLIFKGATYNDKRFAKYNLNNRNNNKQPEKIAQ